MTASTVNRAITASALALTAATAAAQPSLSPPTGAPTESSRFGLATIINDTNTPGDANSVFRITRPGSYILAQDITVRTGETAIEIAADDVTIDLGGRTIIGTSGTDTSGIRGDVRIPGDTFNARRLRVSNGSILDVNTAIFLNFNQFEGLDPNSFPIFTVALIQDATFADLDIAGVTFGVSGNRFTLENSTIDASATAAGGDDVQIAGCKITSASTTAAVSLGRGSHITDCSIRSAGTNTTGISASGSVIDRCAIVSSGSSADGIVANQGSVITACSVGGPALAGTRTGITFVDSAVIGCAVTNFSTGYDGAGDSAISNSSAAVATTTKATLDPSVASTGNNF